MTTAARPADRGFASRFGRRVVARIDGLQRRHAVLAFPYAVVRKYNDDDGGREAALITYYGFLSVFPLLLLGVAILSRVLVANAELRQRLVTAIVPPTIRSTVDESLATLPTSTVAFAVGLIGLVLAATGVVYSVDRTLNHIAAVPYRMRAGAVVRLLRSVVAVAILLAGVVAVGGVTVAVTALSGLPLAGRGLAWLGSALVVFMVLMACGRLVLDRPARWSALSPAAALGAATVALVFQVGAALLAALVTRAGPVYGGFALVAAIFTLLNLVSRALVYAAEVAAVHHARLWPRAIDRASPTAADVRAVRLLGREQERTAGVRIDVRLDAGPSGARAADQPADRSVVGGDHMTQDSGGEQSKGQHVQPADVGERVTDGSVPFAARGQRPGEEDGADRS
jgi:membrane protein